MIRKCTFLWLPLYLIVVAVILWFQPDRSGQIVDTDEPLTAMRALLYHQGFSLYDQIWSDQPPLFSIIFSWSFYWLPPSFETGRVLAGAFGGLLATSLCYIVSKQRGIAAGLIAIVLLLASGRFLRFSGALMVGLPALAFAVLSLAFLFAYQQKEDRRRALLLASGFFFACALFTKLFVILLLPAFGMHFLILGIDRYRAEGSFARGIAPCVWWGGAVAVSALGLVSLFAPALLGDQMVSLFSGHEAMRTRFQGDHLSELIGLAREDIYIFSLAAMGLVFAVSYLRAEYLAPAVWFAVVVQFLRSHDPLWVHHYLLYSLPGVWMAALAVSELWSRPAFSTLSTLVAASRGQRAVSGYINSRIRAFLLVPVLAGVVVWSAARIPASLGAKIRSLGEIGMAINVDVLLRIRELKPSVNWMVTDSGAFAFLNDVRVVPELGLIPLKRVLSGSLTPEQMAEIVGRYKPEVILLHRFPDLRRKLYRLIDSEYEPDRAVKQILVRRDIAVSLPESAIKPRSRSRDRGEHREEIDPQERDAVSTP